jgi:ADP-heptose:LPS heptosyltransferase
MNKYLIIRFSSFGDIAQSLPAAAVIRREDPSAEIHFLTRSDFAEFIKCSSCIDRVIELDRKLGFKGLLKLARSLQAEKYTHLYDAHSNLRSFIVSSILRIYNFHLQYAERSKNRFRRILLFWFNVNRFPKPFRGIESYLHPLKKWFFNVSLPDPLHLQTPDFGASSSILSRIPKDFKLKHSIVLAPSATWELKRWAIENWRELVRLMPETSFVILAGENDVFCDAIAEGNPENVLNLRGRLSWVDSLQIISESSAVISGDTGILHVADVMGKPSIAIIGPTAFGFPTRASSVVAQVDLPCRPCTKDGRGHCTNSKYKRCLTDIKPEYVALLTRRHILKKEAYPLS